MEELKEAQKVLMAKVFESLTPAEQEAVLKYFKLIVGYNLIAEEILKIIEGFK